MSLDQLNLEGYTPKEKALGMLDEIFRAYGDNIPFSEYRKFYDAIEGIHEVEPEALENAIGLVNKAWSEGAIRDYATYSPIFDAILSIDPKLQIEEVPNG